MIIQDIYLRKYDWTVRVYYEVDDVYTDLIIEDLYDIGCENPKETVEDFLSSGLNCGFTYSNGLYRASIIIIGLTSEPAEFQSTFDHEKGHLATHIAEFEDIDLYSEEYQYLVGEIGKQMFEIARLFMCDCNKHTLKNLRRGC